MNYRTKTYIAADWTEDKDAVDQLRKWNEKEYWNLHFLDAHDITKSRDTSLNCTIKASLKKRLDRSKTFVLIVGNNTKKLRSGSCQHCENYSSYNKSCNKGNSVDYRSYIQYECYIAEKYIQNIIVLYKSTKVNKSLCPEILQDVGNHVPMLYNKDGKKYWDYQSVKEALSQ